MRPHAWAMTIVLHVEPTKVPVDKQTFCRTSPPFAIALDGYVNGGPWFASSGPRANFDHHSGVERLATRATCAQVLMALRMGLFQTFRDSSGPRAEVFVNDCDEDVCTAWALIRHHTLVTGTINPLVNRLVAMEDALDCTAGAYPFPADLDALRELAWVYEPYRRIRLSGQLDRKDTTSFEGVITDVEHRILQHVTGKGRELPIDLRFERVGGGNGWTMVREIGAQARTGMFAEGIRAFVAVRDRPDGRYTYTIGKMSPFVPLNLTALANTLNIAEGTTTDQWGGGDTIIGSPRVGGSRLAPTEVAELVHVGHA